MWGLIVIGVIAALVEVIKEKTTKTVPKENFGKDGTAWMQDIGNGISSKERMRRIRSGYYRGK